MNRDKYAHQYKVPEVIVVHYVDAAGVIRRLFILPGEVSGVYLNAQEKSAEVIVVTVTSHYRWKPHK